MREMLLVAPVPKVGTVNTDVTSPAELGFEPRQSDSIAPLHLFTMPDSVIRTPAMAQGLTSAPGLVNCCQVRPTQGFVQTGLSTTESILFESLLYTDFLATVLL